MPTTQFAPRTHRARQILETVGRAYPQAWAQADRMRSMRGQELPDWPDWCYLPVHGAYAIVSGGGERRVPIEHSHHTGIVAALAAWRMGQIVVRYDPALYEALVQTPITGDLPTALLYRLPVWCVYVETPGMLAWEGRPIHGCWAHLDWDADGPAELRLLLDTAVSPDLALDAARGCVPVPLLLGEGALHDALHRLFASWQRQAIAHGYDMHAPAAQYADAVAAKLAPILSLVLYLCSDAPDWSGEPPANPAPVRTRRHGWRLYPADGLRVWDVGVRLGAALRRAYHAQETHQGGTHAGPRPHIRAAHWHTILSGPRLRADGSDIPPAERRRDLRWMPPIPVMLDDVDSLPATVRMAQT